MTTQSDLKRLLAAGLHFGHKTSKWNPKIKPYLFGERNGIHIFDLEKTAQKFTEAMSFLEESIAKGKNVLLVSTKQQTSESLPDLAISLGMPYVTEKWFGGLLTNWNTTKERIKQLRDLKEERDKTNFSRYVKSEANKKMKQIAKLELWLAGIEQLEKKPDIVFVLDIVRDRLAVQESRTCNIPVIGMADSNTDPDLLTYPIPGNDDAIKAINLILSEVHDAVERGQKKFKETGEKNKEEQKSKK